MHPIMTKDIGMSTVKESKLRSNYIASLLVKMASICELWREYDAISKRESSYKELFILVHNLYASAYMHGLYSLAHAAKLLEKALKSDAVGKTDVIDCLGQLSKEIWLAQQLLPRENNKNE